LVLLRSATSIWPGLLTVNRECLFETFPLASTMSLPETRPIVISSLSKVRSLGSPFFSVSVSLIMEPREGVQPQERRLATLFSTIPGAKNRARSVFKIRCPPTGLPTKGLSPNKRLSADQGAIGRPRGSSPHQGAHRPTKGPHRPTKGLIAPAVPAAAP